MRTKAKVRGCDGALAQEADNAAAADTAHTHIERRLRTLAIATSAGRTEEPRGPPGP